MRKNLFKKLFAAALTATLAVGALAGCGGSGSGSAEPAQGTEATTEAGTQEAEPAQDTADAGIFRTLDQIKDSGKIIIGVFSDKAPFGYVDENGDYQGYDVYFAERLAKDLGVEVEYYPTDPASRVEIASTGKVDLVLANFTVTPERAEQVDFALPYMKVALGVVSPESDPITDVAQLEGKELIVCKGTTAETFFEQNYPEVKLQKYEQYADAYNALLDGRGAAFSTDNTEVLAWAIANSTEDKSFVVGIDSLGSLDTIAPAVAKGNTTLLDWVNSEIVALGDENFFHADYDATLKPVYGDAADPDSLVVEGGVVKENETEEPEGVADDAILPVDGDNKIVVGATPVPHATILEDVVAGVLAKDGWELETQVFEDYVLPNTSLDAKELDANYFQTLGYMDQQNADRGLHLVAVAGVHIEPMGIYSQKYTAIADIPDGASIGIPNDPDNGERALDLLVQKGLLVSKGKLGTDDSYTFESVTTDAEANPHGYVITPLEAASLPLNLPDLDAAAINGNYALGADLPANYPALEIEEFDAETSIKRTNFLVVNEGEENSPKTQALIRALQSKEVEDFINSTYKGAVITSFIDAPAK